jgi:hypothetical protein
MDLLEERQQYDMQIRFAYRALEQTSTATRKVRTW